MSVTVHLAIRVAALALLQATVAAADPVNIDGDPLAIEHMLATEPMKIVSAEISRPKAHGDITLKADVAFGDRAPLRVKLRKAMPGADTFNNVPRYDLAAYELQKLLVDPADFVVPPTVLRMIPAAELRSHEEVESTFVNSDDVLNVVQYWLKDIAVIEDVFDAAKFIGKTVTHTLQNASCALCRHSHDHPIKQGRFTACHHRPDVCTWTQYLHRNPTSHARRR